MPIDTDRTRLPADLQGRALDDPEVIPRFERLLDYVFAQIPDVELAVRAIDADADAWDPYQAFFEAAAAHACGLRPDVHGGVVHVEAVRKAYTAAI